MPQPLAASNADSTDTYTCTFVANPGPGAHNSTHVNEVTATAVDDDGDTVTAEDTATVTRVGAPGIQIDKEADDPAVDAGDPIGFTITVRTTGTADVTGVVSLDTLPTGPGITWSESSEACSIAAAC